MVEQGSANHESLLVQQNAGDDGVVISSNKVVRLRQQVCLCIEFLDLLNILQAAVVRHMRDRDSPYRGLPVKQTFAMLQLLLSGKNRIWIGVVPCGSEFAHPVDLGAFIDKDINPVKSLDQFVEQLRRPGVSVEQADGAPLRH